MSIRGLGGGRGRILLLRMTFGECVMVLGTLGVIERREGSSRGFVWFGCSGKTCCVLLYLCESIEERTVARHSNEREGGIKVSVHVSGTYLYCWRICVLS
jgi:hypothetical protein